MTKTFTPTNFKTDPTNRSREEFDNSEERFYRTIKSKLDTLERNPSEDIISKILNYAKKR